MNRIIVTIRIKQKKEYDLELPVNQKIKDLMGNGDVTGYVYIVKTHAL